ncbi:hypothetical protein ACRE_048430 [Hapsidospora chrysogenum ATCC 11550]|uniref:Uncharacterized protein n=1 Tax=Hapsidospora chrysogenum (strain ATCC 11550 / CBS 779.69 / DSM 880 / IAM 14645 / JCM 23072 / IMI 49137) TaxID=857340 RepID=A0A086T4U9_HAPC1|nr:hypothetical protein ACRE_048430 [Hapsidospora chrysogenum ATCC 11550]
MARIKRLDAPKAQSNGSRQSAQIAVTSQARPTGPLRSGRLPALYLRLWQPGRWLVPGGAAQMGRGPRYGVQSQLGGTESE